MFILTQQWMVDRLINGSSLAIRWEDLCSSVKFTWIKIQSTKSFAHSGLGPFRPPSYPLSTTAITNINHIIAPKVERWISECWVPHSRDNDGHKFLSIRRILHVLFFTLVSVSDGARWSVDVARINHCGAGEIDGMSKVIDSMVIVSTGECQ